LRRHIEEAGFETWARTYPSRRVPLAELAADVGQRIREDHPNRPILGVTHSMGGIIARHLHDTLPWQGLVMLAPPNQGSRVVSHLKGSRLFRWYFGPAGQALGDPENWPPPPRPTAVIAGSRGPSIGNPPSWLTSGFSLLDPEEPHDGTLTLSETRHPDVVDYALVEASHTWIMNHPHAQELVVRFLRHGHFGETAPEGE
jgi:hypothetical protein